MIKVGIVDDHAIVRMGLRDFLAEQGDIEVTGEAADGFEAVELIKANRPDVLILDLSMPQQSGVEILVNLLNRAPGMAILILTGYAAEHYAVNLIRKGAQGFLSKDCDPLLIVKAVRTLAVGRRYITPEVAELLAQQLTSKEGEAPHEKLSEREFNIFLRLAKGESVGEIANALSLSAKTVSTYRSRAMEKLGLTSNSDLTYYALKNGLIE